MLSLKLQSISLMCGHWNSLHSNGLNQSGHECECLVSDSGLNSGFMMAQVTAAALATENKSLAHPASVDSLPASRLGEHLPWAKLRPRQCGLR